MITGICKDDTKEYICEVEMKNKVANPTIFILGVLTQKDKVNLLSASIREDGKIDFVALQNKSAQILEVGLRGIKNYAVNNKSEPKDYDKVDSELIETLPMTIQSEVAGQIVAFNFLMESEAKN